MDAKEDYFTEILSENKLIELLVKCYDYKMFISKLR